MVRLFSPRKSSILEAELRYKGEALYNSPNPNPHSYPKSWPSRQDSSNIRRWPSKLLILATITPTLIPILNSTSIRIIPSLDRLYKDTSLMDQLSDGISEIDLTATNIKLQCNIGEGGCFPCHVDSDAEVYVAHLHALLLCVYLCTPDTIRMRCRWTGDASLPSSMLMRIGSLHMAGSSDSTPY